MSEKFILSVIIVNYNGEKYLREALDSICNQYNENVELIVIDGGSSDGSVGIIQGYSDCIDIILSEPDSGQSDALNKGIGLSSGRFFMWLNSDDVMMKGSIEMILKAIKNSSKTKWFSGNTIFINSNGIVQKCSKGPRWNNFLFRNNYVSVFGPTSVVRREVFDELGKFDLDLSYCMDTDYWYRMFNAGYRYQKIDHYLFGFRIHQDSKTSHAFFNDPNEYFQIEQKDILLRNGIKILNWKVWLLRIWKLICFSYVISKVDSSRHVGKHYALIYRKYIK